MDFGLEAVVDIYMFYRLLDFKDDDRVTRLNGIALSIPPNDNMYSSVG